MIIDFSNIIDNLPDSKLQYEKIKRMYNKLAWNKHNNSAVERINELEKLITEIDKNLNKISSMI